MYTHTNTTKLVEITQDALFMSDIESWWLRATTILKNKQNSQYKKCEEM